MTGFSMQAWHKLASRYILDALPFLRVRQDECQLPDGRIISDYYVVEQSEVVMVCALTPQREVLLVEQYRHAIATTCIELPAGVCNSDDFAAEILRELREETGYAADPAQLHYLTACYPMPPRLTNRVHYFLALDVQHVGEQELDALEDITLHVVPLNEALTMARAGRINGSDALACLLLAADYLACHGV
jgi:ADP-ribose pyrophosphatase